MIQRNCDYSSGVTNCFFSLDLFNSSCYTQVLDENCGMGCSPLGYFWSLTLSVTAFSTFKIFHIVRRHQRQINDQNMAALNVQTNTVNVLKCKKSAVTVLYIYGLLLIFYLPFGVTMLVEAFIGYTRSVKIAYDYATTAVFINSFLDPLVYCWRIRDIRRAVKNVLRRQ